MTQHHHDFHAEHGGAVLETGDDLRSADVARHATDKDVSNALVEDELDRHTGIRAGQHRGEWLLFRHGSLLQNGQVLLEGGEASADKASIAVHELSKGCVRRKVGLCNRRTSPEKG